MATVRKPFGQAQAWGAGWTPGSARKPQPRLRDRAATRAPAPLRYTDATHPFADNAIATELDHRENDIEAGFARIAPVLQELAPMQFSAGFADLAVSRLNALGIAAETAWFASTWTAPINFGDVYARCVSRLFAKQVETGSEKVRYRHADTGESVEDLIANWGFHAVDITPCADGRLSGLLGAVLRVPFSIVSARRSYAGAMFPVAEALNDWEDVALSRHLAAAPDQPDPTSRYLKIGVFHFSSLNPTHEGCAAHGSCDATAVRSLLARLIEFKGAVRAKHDAEVGVALLLVGVDTDTDAIRVHVPDGTGRIRADRFVDARDLHGATATLSKGDAKAAVRAAVAECAGVAGDDLRTEGMRWFCGYLLKNNIAQVDAVLARHGGAYPVAGHAEKLIVIGDPVDDVQLRNLAFQAQMGSVEEGAADLAVGFRILGPGCAARGLSVPVLVVRDYDPEIPGDAEAAQQAARRMQRAVAAQAPFPTAVEAAIRSDADGPLAFLPTLETTPSHPRAAT